MGAAILAMVGDGAYEDVEQCIESVCTIKGTESVDPEIAERYDARYKQFKLIYPSVKDLFKQLKY